MDEPHREVRELQKRICSWALSSALIVALFLLFFHEKAMAKGLVLGTLFSILNFLLLGKTIPMVLGLSRPRASAVGMATTLARYALLAVPMVVALKTSSFDFLAAAVGVFAVQIVTLVDYMVIKPLSTGK